MNELDRTPIDAPSACDERDRVGSRVGERFPTSGWGSFPAARRTHPRSSLAA